MCYNSRKKGTAKGMIRNTEDYSGLPQTEERMRRPESAKRQKRFLSARNADMRVPSGRGNVSAANGIPWWKKKLLR